MKTIGLIGGTGWESTLDYYRYINQGVRARLGGFHSAKLLLSSVDFAPFESWMRHGERDAVGAALAREARLLEQAGAEGILLATNTMHKTAGRIEAAITVPFIDIRDTCGRAIAEGGFKRPLLLGTRYAMVDDFFTARLVTSFGLAPAVPDVPDETTINDIIFNELVNGIVSPASNAVYRRIVGKAREADCVIFGCTEIGTLLKPDDLALPVFDTLRLHVDAALAFAL